MSEVPSGPELPKRRIWDSPAFTVLNTTACVVGTLSLVVAAPLVVLTFFDRSPFGTGEFGAPFGLVFPLWAWMFATLYQRGVVRRAARPYGTRVTGGGATGGSWRNVVGLIPRSLRFLAVGLFVASWIVGATATKGLGGQPQYDPTTDRYSLNDHGSLIAVSHAGYVHAVALQNRLFLSGALAFTAIATAVAWGEWHRRRETSEGSWPAPTRSRPRWVPPIGVALVVLLLGVAATSTLVSRIITRVDAYTATAPHLHPDGNTTVALTPGDYVIFVGCTQTLVCPTLTPGNVAVHNRGSALTTITDPSSDHLSLDAQPFLGSVSFRVSRAGAYAITTRHGGRPTLIVIHSPGQEFAALTGWIVGAILGLLVMTYGGASVTGWYVWRYGAGSAGKRGAVRPPHRPPPWPPPVVGH